MPELIYDPLTRSYQVATDDEPDYSRPLPLTPLPEPTGGAGQTPTSGPDIDRAAINAAQAEISKPEPLVPTSIGGFIGDSAKTITNIGVGIGTGLVDLGLLAVDAARASTGDFGGLTQGSAKRPMAWSEVGEDRDNPLTRWRVQTLTPESTAFKAINYMGEVASWFVGGPRLLGKVGIGAKVGKEVATGAKLADVAGDVAKSDIAISGLSKAVGTLLKPANVDRYEEAVKAVRSVPSMAAGPAAKFINRFQALDDLPARQLEAALRSSQAGNPLARAAGFIAGNIDEYIKTPLAGKLQIFGEVVLKDLAANSMVAGRRPTNEDESGISRWLAENAPPYFSAAAQFLVPDDQDAALVAKAKIVTEGSIISFATQPLMDAARIAYMSRGFRKAEPAVQQQILGLLEKPERAADLVIQEARRAEAGVTPPVGAAPAGVGAEPPLSPRGEPTAPGATPATGLATPTGEPTLDDLAQLQQVTKATSDAARALNRTAEQEQVFERARTALGRPGSAPGPTTAMAPEASAGTANVGAPGPATALAPEAPAGTTWEPLPTPKAVVSPEAIRNAAKAELNNYIASNGEAGMDPEAFSGFVEELGKKVVGLIPPDRAGRVDYMKTFKPRLNRAGVMDPIDAIWNEQIVRGGLQEGWVRLADDFSSYQFNRAEAQAIDESDALGRLADEVANGTQLERLVRQPSATQAIDAAGAPPAGAVDLPAGEQTVDVQAQQVAGEPPAAGAPPTGAPVDMAGEAAVTQQQARIGAAGNQLTDTMRAGAERQAPTPAAGMAEPMAGPQAAADQPQPGQMATGAPGTPGAPGAAGASPQGAGDQMEQLLQQILDNPGAAGTPTRAANAQRAEMILADMERTGRIQGTELKNLDAEVRGMFEPASPQGLAAQAAREAQGQEVMAREFSDVVFEGVNNPIPPKMTDGYMVSLSLTPAQRSMLESAINAGSDTKVLLNGTAPTVGAKSLSEGLAVLEFRMAKGDMTPQELRTAKLLTRDARAALVANGEAINDAAEFEGLMKEAWNDVQNQPNCDLTELL